MNRNNNNNNNNNNNQCTEVMIFGHKNMGFNEIEVYNPSSKNIT